MKETGDPDARAKYLQQLKDSKPIAAKNMTPEEREEFEERYHHWMTHEGRILALYEAKTTKRRDE